MYCPSGVLHDMASVMVLKTSMCEDCCGDCVIWLWRVFSFSEYENSTVEEHSIAFVQVLMKRKAALSTVMYEAMVGNKSLLPRFNLNGL